MSDYTAVEVEKAFRGLDLTALASANSGQQDAVLLRGEAVKVSKVDALTGDYDSSDYDSVWIVVKVGDQLFKKTGWYASHSGHDWDGDTTEVHATEKTITVYE